jgi:sortase A
MDSRSFRKINTALLALIILINVYVLVAPILPAISYKLHPPKVAAIVLPSEQKTTTETAPTTNTPKPAGDQLIIPSIGLQAPVLDGKYANTLDKGLWRRPKTSTPDKGSNVVIAGHRFRYKDYSYFYNLPSAKIGDRIELDYKDHKYYYQVSETKIVDPYEVSIEKPSLDDQLTLYTCTPMWTSKQRFVVIATLLEHT